MSRIVVTGIGIITAIGDSLSKNRSALINGKSGIGKAHFFNSKYRELFPFGEIEISSGNLASSLPFNNPSATRTDLLALYAANQAIIDAQLSPKELSSAATALIGASTVGGMCLTDEVYADANSISNNDSPYLSSYASSVHSSVIQQHFHIGGIVNTFNTACSSSANAIMYGARLIKSGLASKVIAGGADSLSKYTANGFNALMILSGESCQPFDANRKGLNLGEAAAFVVLEKEEDAINKPVYATIAGYGNSNDAFHPSSTSDSGDGPFLSMQRALRSAGLQPGDIDFINAHGTATENNDITESIAMNRLFQVPPQFASTKSYTGHTLGAAGVVEAVYSMLSLQFQEVYSSLNFKTPIEATRLVPVAQYQRIALKHVMSNSFGFGGNCTSLIFSKI